MRAQSCLTLYDPVNCSPPGSSVHGIFQARTLEWVAIPTPGDLPEPGIEPTSPTLAGKFLPLRHLESQGHHHLPIISFNKIHIRGKVYC